ncbi:MAG: 5-formyltetrahydrofolate cyclo-ligase [Chitinophagaceae bacterium]
MEKKILRNIYLSKRRNIPLEEKKRLEKKIFLLFQTLTFKFPVKAFLSYRFIQEKNEIDISLIENYMEKKFEQIKKCYPVVSLSNKKLETISVNKDTLFCKNYWNIEEPINGISIDKKFLDVIFIPMLIFDKDGFRVGYGKGMYDKLFSTCKKDVLKIGFCCFEPIQKIDNLQPYDVSLDIIITPEKIFRIKV